jgi:hypothetical protein
MAKLLSKNEQSNTQEISKYTQSKRAIKALLTPYGLLLFILLVVCATRMQASCVLISVNDPAFELRQALREAFFVRPPPILTA